MIYFVDVIFESQEWIQRRGQGCTPPGTNLCPYFKDTVTNIFFLWFKWVLVFFVQHFSHFTGRHPFNPAAAALPELNWSAPESHIEWKNLDWTLPGWLHDHNACVIKQGVRALLPFCRIILLDDKQIQYSHPVCGLCNCLGFKVSHLY